MSHNINVTCIELTSGSALDIRNDGEKKWGRIFALHNRYTGANKPEITVAYSVSFGANTIALAEKTIAQVGSSFVVTGEITGVSEPSAEHPDRPSTIYLRADQLRPLQRRAAATDNPEESAAPSRANRPPRRAAANTQSRS